VSKVRPPDKWSVFALDELRAPGDYTLVGGPFGSDLTTSDYVSKPGVPVIRGTNLGGKESVFVDEGFVYVSERKAESLRRNTAYRGDIVFTQRGTLGQVALIPKDSRFDRYVISQSQMKLTPDVSRVNCRFLYYYFRSPQAIYRLLSETQATGVPHINLGILKRFPVLLPPLAEQRRIAEVLDRAEALRAKRSAALAQLDTLTQYIFLDLFGDPITNPKNWPTVRFEEICDRVTVGIVVKPASYYVAEGVPALRSLNIKPGKIVLQDLVYFSKADNETKLTKTKLKAGDLVLVRSGQPGTAAVVPRELDGVNAIDLLIATPLPKLADVMFLCDFFNSAGGRDLVLSRQRGQVQKHLNVGALNEAIIPLPPITLQRDFARRVAAVERAKELHRASLAEMDALFASLQHRAFRGEL
jgi:type I restriction enzyme, S subunit